jgi:hypothetical protein
MKPSTLHQHRKRAQGDKPRTQKLSHTIASITGRVNPNAGAISLAPVNALTLEEIEAKYGQTPTFEPAP